MSKPFIFEDSTTAKALRRQLNLNDSVKILSADDDPTSTSKDAPRGSIYMRTGSSGGDVFVKKDDGDTTNWEIIGAGAGGINHIGNPDSEVGVTGWSAYADAAGVSPVDGTGGSPTTTITRTTSTPLRGTGSFLITKDAADRQGEGASYDFTIDEADKSSPMRFSFDYSASANFAFNGGAAGDESDIMLWIYDVTNSVLIQPTPYGLDGSGAFVGEFQASSDSTSYRIIWHIATTNASAWTFKYDNVVVGPSPITKGAVIGDWVDYTPSTNGLGTVTVNQARWRRNGPDVDIDIKITAGTPTAAQMQVGFPSGITSSSSLVQKAIASLHTNASGSVSPSTVLVAPSDTNFLFGAASDASGGGQAAVNGNDIVAASDVFSVTASFPVEGWGAGTVQSDDASTRVVTAQYRLNTADTITAGADTVLNFDTLEYDTHSAVTNPGTDWKFVAPISGYYGVNLNFRVASAAWVVQQEVQTKLFVNGSQVEVFDIQEIETTNKNVWCNATTSVQLNAGDDIQIKCNLSGAVSSTFVASSTLNRLNIKRLSGPATILASEKVFAEYTHDGTAADTTLDFNAFDTIDYNVKVKDTHGAVTTGASWVFTAPKSGVYTVSAGLLLDASIPSGSARFVVLSVYKNGSEHRRFGSTLALQSANSISYGNQGTVSVDLVAGDTISIRGFQDLTSSAARTINTSTILTYVSIVSQGGI